MTIEEQAEQWNRALQDVQELMDQGVTAWSIVYAVWWRVSRMEALGHVYLATSCQHGKHDYCKNTKGQAGPKRPAECKFCEAPCVCPCHQEESHGDPGPGSVE